MTLDFKCIALRSSGLSELLDDLEARDKAMCECSAAVQYHLGAREVRRLVRQAGLVTVNNDTRLCPVYVAPELFQQRDQFEASQKELAERVQSAHRILQTAFQQPAYRVKKRLSEQPPPIKQHVKELFGRLILRGHLPAAFRDIRFGHLGMVLLMRECAPSEEVLIGYLKDPEKLHLDSVDQKSLQTWMEAENNKPGADPPFEAELTVQERVFSQVDLIRALEVSDEPSREQKLDAAYNELVKLMQPSPEELDARFERHFAFDSRDHEKAMIRAKQKLGDDVDPSKAD